MSKRPVVKGEVFVWTRRGWRQLLNGYIRTRKGWRKMRPRAGRGRHSPVQAMIAADPATERDAPLTALVAPVIEKPIPAILPSRRHWHGKYNALQASGDEGL